jgi:hypothetical protein
MPIASPPAPAKSSTLLIKKSPDHGDYAMSVPELAFPKNQHLPPLPRERTLVSHITFLIARKLRFPEVETGLWHPRERAARVAVPETAVNENNLSPLSENDIGLPGQIARMESVSVAKRENKSTNQQFRSGVL